MSKKASAVKPAKKKTPHVGEATISLRHDFTDTEYREIGGKLNIALNTRNSLETELKTLSQDYKARIAQQDGTVDEMNNKLGNGYEMRQTKVQVVFDATKGRKYFFALDDKKRKTVVGEADMMPSDFQVELPIAGLVGAAKAAGMAADETARAANVVPMPMPQPLVSVGAAIESAEIDIEAQAVEVIRSEGKCSALLLMKRLRIGIGEADGILESLASRGIIASPPSAAGAYDVVALPPPAGTPAMNTENPPPPPAKKKSDKRKPTKAEFQSIKAGESEGDK